MTLRTCVSPDGTFRYAVHEPSYSVTNLREEERLDRLGRFADGTDVLNAENFPRGGVEVPKAKVIYEVPNAFPFRGTTYIDSSWADSRRRDPESIRLPMPTGLSMGSTLRQWADSIGMAGVTAASLLASLPAPLLLTLATGSTDPEDLTALAELSCELVHDRSGNPEGLRYVMDSAGGRRPVLHDHDLFEAVANNPFLPDEYKRVMVLRPGAQGGSPIVGEYRAGETHIYEYLRENSYIPWGHYAANFADDQVRYLPERLTREDMSGLRHLYYQRTFRGLAAEIGIAAPAGRPLSVEELEGLRLSLSSALSEVKPGEGPRFSSSLWGWNLGFDFAPSGYRLHASHQQVHQQYAFVPARIQARESRGGEIRGELEPYSSGDLVAGVVREYRLQSGQSLFDDYVRALRSNTRMDGRKGEGSLIVHEDDQTILFVPKAQVSQWELQLMPLAQVGNILEADERCRESMDRAMLLAVRTLCAMGARMITSIEYSKRFTDRGTDQRLLYSFLPKLPYSPGAFSEAQLRFICGHYPEDFALACRRALARVLETGV
jgi:hypothetical protein